MTDLSVSQTRSVSLAAAAFGIKADSIQPLLGGLSGSGVFRVLNSDGVAFVIRLTPLNLAIPAERLSLLHRLLHCTVDLGQTGIPVPLLPVRTLTTNASIIRQVGDSWCVLDDFRVTAETWIHGQPVATMPNHEQLNSALGRLRSFHERLRLAAASLPMNEWFFVRDDHSPGLIRRSQLVHDLKHGELDRLAVASANDSDPVFRSLSRSAMEAVRAWLPWLLENLSTCTTMRLPLQPVVRDLWRPHLLFEGNDATGIIDLSSAASDHFVTDFARLFRSWYGDDHTAMNDACRMVAEQYSLTSQECRLLQCLDACSTLLSPVTWIRRRLESSSRSTLPEDIRRRMEHLVHVAGQFQPVL